MLRGGGYGGEWASNVHTGSTSAHYGFTTPVAAVFASLKAYLAQIAQEGDPGELKLWIGGYSRGAIIANLLAAKALNTLPQLDKANCFVYTLPPCGPDRRRPAGHAAGFRQQPQGRRLAARHLG